MTGAPPLYSDRINTGALIPVLLGLLVFVVVLALTAAAVGHGLIGDDVLRLWAGASTAADGEVPIGRIVAAYPSLPFMMTTLVAWMVPAGTPAPALVAAALLATIAACCFRSLRNAAWPVVASVIVTLLIVLHPALLRAVLTGPSDVFLAAFLLMLCLALYDLRARSGASEVMKVGLALMALAFSHPLGAAFAFTSVPFLAFAVRPAVVANSALNLVLALVFPTVFAVGAFTYVAWIFPGDGWTFLAAPAETLSAWTAALPHLFGERLSSLATLQAAVGMALMLVLGAPAALYLVSLAHRRRPLVVPAVVFGLVTIATAAISVLSGAFGEPTALVVAAPALAVSVVICIPGSRERLTGVIALLVIGWVGGGVALGVADPITLSRVTAAFDGGGGRVDALAAGAAAAGYDGVLTDVDNAPVFVVGRGNARGILGPQSESFALAMLFARVETPFVAVPDPHSAAGINDRLDKAFPLLFRDGLPGYRLIYHNETWRLFARVNAVTVSASESVDQR